MLIFFIDYLEFITSDISLSALSYVVWPLVNFWGRHMRIFHIVLFYRVECEVAPWG